jgi:cysteine desulfurase / selenocysteine lyase
MFSQGEVRDIRRDFPALQQCHPQNSRPPIYLDNSCVTLTPRPVAEAVWAYSVSHPGCGGHRSQHWFASVTQNKVESARRALGDLLGVRPVTGSDGEENSPIIFTRNTTESLNLVANCIGLLKGETVVLTDKEHNSNLCPWQEFERRSGKLAFVPVQQDNRFDLACFATTLETDSSVKLVALHHCSNLDGVAVPLHEVVAIVRRIEKSQRRHIFISIDGAQAVPHMKLNLEDPNQPKHLDVDFYAGSIHKMLGPTGIGFLYGRPECLDNLRPFMVGGSTIFETSVDHRPLYAEWPDRFEAGLQNYAGLIGAGAAAIYLKPLLNEIQPYEQYLNKTMTEILAPLHHSERLQILGPLDASQRGGIVTFVLPTAPQDPKFRQFESEALAMNVMYRSGHFCVDSWFNSHSNRLPLRYTAVRFSCYIYNTLQEVETAALLVANTFGRN